MFTGTACPRSNADRKETTFVGFFGFRKVTKYNFCAVFSKCLCKKNVPGTWYVYLDKQTRLNVY